MPDHNTLTGADLHEPKGASGASVDEVYVSDGAGSGTWKKPEADTVTIADAGNIITATDVEAALQEMVTNGAGGWGLYVDNGASSQTITTTAAVLAVNGLDTDTITNYLPL
jgi:hypothetical protein